MSDFDDEWLTLREPADHAARSQAITEEICRWASKRGPMQVLDLGAGTGSNFRFLAPHLGHNQEWQLIDHNPVLLATVPARLTAWAHANGYTVSSQSGRLTIAGKQFSAFVNCRLMDLANDLPSHNSGHVDLITASALLDLASAEWIDGLVSQCQMRACAALFTLSYNGLAQWQPPLADDEQMLHLMNQHQQRDKGLGLALGPLAADHCAKRMTDAGFIVSRHRSDWKLGTATETTQDAVSLQQTLVSGWAEAVAELDPSVHRIAANWLEQRLSFCRTKSSNLSIGHLDVLGLPPARM